MMEFTDIREYILKSKEERQSHLDLNEECICIGGMSGEYRALLAYYLQTTIPTKLKIYLCHACNNGRCSNPKHLYWGTPKDNYDDLRQSGKWKSVYQATKDKYGEEFMRKQQRKAASSGGKAKRITSLTNERLAEINSIIQSEPKGYGYIVRLEKKLGVSHTQVRRYIKLINGRVEQLVGSPDS